MSIHVTEHSPDATVADAAAPVVDVVGIGFGPANLALAIALEEEGFPLRAVFLEADADPVWQSGMLLRGADIQHNPHRDLVSLRNPRSRYSFINYLHETGRLLKYLNVPARFPLRREYADYIRWARRLVPADVRYGVRVDGIDRERLEGGETVYRVHGTDGTLVRGRAVVLGPGRTPYVPDVFAACPDPRIHHLQSYLPSLTPFGDTGPSRVVVVGGSQSAVEIALDLLDRFPGTRVDIVSRSWSLRAKDHSPFSGEIYLPDFTDHYYHAPVPHRRRLDAFTRPTNYSAADLDVLERLYLAQHEQQLEGAQRVFLHGDAEITHVRPQPERVDLLLRHAVTGARTVLAADLVLLATGFRDMGKGTTGEPHHPLLSGLAGVFGWTADGYLDVAEDYALVPTAPDVPPVYLNGLCESTHGIGDAGSFSLLSLRAQIILRGLQQALAKVPA